MTIVSTATKKPETIGLNANHMVLFVPNKPSMPNIIFNDEMHSEFYDFCRAYFYGVGTNYEEFKPFAYAGYMLEEIEDDEWGSAEYASDDEHTIYTTPNEWLRDVIDNFGPDVVLVCSDYV